MNIPLEKYDMPEEEKTSMIVRKIVPKSKKIQLKEFVEDDVIDIHLILRRRTLETKKV